MYPDQNQYSIDYLNQIAAPEKKPGLSSKLFMIIVIGGVLLAAIVGILLISKAGGTSPTTDLTSLAARLSSLQKVSSKAQTSIQSGKLQTVNSTLSLALTGANRDIATPLKNNNVIMEKADKTLVAAESLEVVSKKLEDARLNVKYDSVYSSEMKYQLDLTISLMDKIYKQTKSESLKTYLKTTADNMIPIRQQFIDYIKSATID